MLFEIRVCLGCRASLNWLFPKIQMMKFLTLQLSLWACWVLPALALPERVAILGDSITFGGRWATRVEFALRGSPGFADAEIVNFGLSSETVSGLSEAGHAGGAFPRPCLHERLARVLDEFKPSRVLACYGMNDGIYLPLADERQQAFMEGCRKLKAAVEKRGATLVFISAPLFGADQPTGDTLGYDAVLDAQADWLRSQTTELWQVIDIRPELRSAIAAEKRKNPSFIYAKDRIHPGPEGHDFIAAAVTEQLWKCWSLPGVPAVAEGQAFSILSERHEILKLAWLTRTRHTRPGIPAGLPWAEAETRAAVLLEQYREALKQDR